MEGAETQRDVGLALIFHILIAIDCSGIDLYLQRGTKEKISTGCCVAWLKGIEFLDLGACAFPRGRGSSPELDVCRQLSWMENQAARDWHTFLKVSASRLPVSKSECKFLSCLLDTVFQGSS